MSGDGSGPPRTGGRHGGGGRYGDRGGGYGGSDGGSGGGYGGNAAGGYGGASGRVGSGGSGYGGNSQTRGDRGGDDRGGSRSNGSGRERDLRCTNPSGNGGGGGGGSYGSKGGDGGAYSKGPPVLPPTYGGSSLPPPTSYTGGPNSYPPSYGGAAGNGGDAPPAESPVQCDENCDDLCDNSRIYISNLPPDVTIDELKDLFGGIGQVGRIKQKRGYKDQWPWNIKIYTDDKGKNKGDACVVYEDPAAAHSAGSFYNNHDLRGYKINVAMAEKSAPRAPPVHGQRGGGRGGYGGGGDRRRDGGASGPDRSYHGGNRSRPY